MSNATASTIDFEKSLAELESLVKQMETGSLTLEESLQAFERGVKLTRQCQSALQQAELRVKKMMDDGGDVDAPPTRSTPAVEPDHDFGATNGGDDDIPF